MGRFRRSSAFKSKKQQQKKATPTTIGGVDHVLPILPKNTCSNPATIRKTKDSFLSRHPKRRRRALIEFSNEPLPESVLELVERAICEDTTYRAILPRGMVIDISFTASCSHPCEIQCQRALSRIWWTLSTRQFTSQGIDVALLEQALTRWTETETGVISNGQGGFQLNYVSFPVIPPQSAWKPNQPFQVQDPDQVHGYIEQALQEYDFFLVQERLDESLVALQLLLGLETADILSMPLHVGGSYLYDRIAGCIELNYGDYLLWGAAQASLDQTIEKLGLSRFQTALEEFHQLQEAVMQTCSQQVVFPCSHNGDYSARRLKPGNKNANGDRYPQADIEACIDQVVAKRLQSKWQNA
ncbi:expressed unknown protein [Seminavis robusta]|uniref:Uncharacterized protein n=1 Tax=Seminavis robusta TaxID=568900 RepID=A0A9N8EE63_9STRA|nr:expressed unknown protein [Seminavis robusta]|eukprot:Sro1021_g232290.1 n/a (356) ;mRNA; r:37017-38176